MAREAGMLEGEAAPGYVRAGHGLDETWMPFGACRNSNGVVGLMWTVEPRGERLIGETVYKHSTLIQLALQICNRCPVQWECAEYAIRSHSWLNQRGRLTIEVHNTWGARANDLNWLAHQDDWGDALREAAEEWEPVQVMVRRRRAC